MRGSQSTSALHVKKPGNKSSRRTPALFRNRTAPGGHLLPVLQREVGAVKKWEARHHTAFELRDFTKKEIMGITGKDYRGRGLDMDTSTQGGGKKLQNKQDYVDYAKAHLKSEDPVAEVEWHGQSLGAATSTYTLRLYASYYGRNHSPLLIATDEESGEEFFCSLSPSKIARWHLPPLPRDQQKWSQWSSTFAHRVRFSPMNGRLEVASEALDPSTGLPAAFTLARLSRRDRCLGTSWENPRLVELSGKRVSDFFRYF